MPEWTTSADSSNARAITRRTGSRASSRQRGQTGLSSSKWRCRNARLAVRGESPASHPEVPRRTQNGDARLARRDEGDYRQYLTEKQRRQVGCSAIRMQRDFHHGPLAPDEDSRATGWKNLAGRRRYRCYTTRMGGHVTGPSRGHAADQYGGRRHRDGAGAGRDASRQCARHRHVGCAGRRHPANQHGGFALDDREGQRWMWHRRGNRRGRMYRRVAMRRILQDPAGRCRRCERRVCPLANSLRSRASRGTMAATLPTDIGTRWTTMTAVTAVASSKAATRTTCPLCHK